MIAAMREALAAITDRDGDKTVSTLLLLGANYISFILLCLTANSRRDVPLRRHAPAQHCKKPTTMDLCIASTHIWIKTVNTA
jgi:hypothetical protein